ncbi:MAG: hypothetical protein OWQ48_01095 [Desulfurococcus sp.]|nr:hypothetical protein [Desulfurococcus sp.]
MRQRRALLLLVSLTLVAAVSPGALAANSEVDCLYHLAVLEKTLNYATGLDPQGSIIAWYMANATMPQLQFYRDTWTTILGYYDVVGEVASPVGVLNASSLYYKIAGVVQGLTSIRGYAETLASCSRDRSSASKLIERINLELESMESKLSGILEILTEVYSGVIEVGVSPPRDYYEPGEKVYVELRAAGGNYTPRFLSVYTWPSLILVERSIFSSIENRVLLEIPSAKELYEKGLTRDVRSGVLKLVLTVELDAAGRTVRVSRILEARYYTPEITLNASVIDAARGLLRVQVASDQEYTGLLEINGERVANITLKPGLNELEVSIERPLNQVVTLRLCVEATAKTLPACTSVSLGFNQVPIPRISLQVDSPVFTLLGSLGFTLVNEEDKPVNVTVYAGDLVLFNGLLAGSTTLSMHAGYLPFNTVVIRVVVEAYTARTPVLEKNIIVVNTMSLAAAASTILVSGILLRRRVADVMQGALTVLTRVKRKTSRLRPTGLKEYQGILKPYALGLGSRIARLYYDVVAKLGARLPYPPETLREHYSSAVSPAISRSLVKEIVERLMYLAERDMYSTRKPSLPEAEKLYRGVVNARRK